MLSVDNGITSEVIEWFATKGIEADTLFDFKIASNSECVDFPYIDAAGELIAVKKRYGVPTGKRSFVWPKGKHPSLYNLRDAGKPKLFLVEGETDCMRLRQAIGDNPDVGVIGLPGIETWNADLAPVFKGASHVWVILDNDDDYSTAGRVDNAFRMIRNDVGIKARRIKLPGGVKDICEFFVDYDLDALRTIVDRQPRAGDSHFPTLDLTSEPPPVNWLVHNLICRGDIHLLIGEPGIGKSWLTMDLTLAVAGVRDTFLGHKVDHHGRVLYFDEENPEDLIFDRMTKLGLTTEAAKNIRYISNVGIRLDKDPDAVIDEALSFEPTLIILDSLTRFHTEDENSAGIMSGLFHNAFKPLARDTGAAVVLIHHANKTDSNSGYKRSRGSGDITASVDAGFDVRELGSGILQLVNFKSRRIAQGEHTYLTLKDTADGQVVLDGGPDLPVPF